MKSTQHVRVLFILLFFAFAYILYKKKLFDIFSKNNVLKKVQHYLLTFENSFGKIIPAAENSNGFLEKHY
jgi:hypothetical protein